MYIHNQQWRSQNAEKARHIKGRLLAQAMILFNCVPFQMGTSLKGKNLLPEGANSFLYQQFLIVSKITFITLTVILLPAHPASFAHNFVSGMQSFNFSESQDAMVLQTCH